MGEASIAAAVREKKAFWGIEEGVLVSLRVRGIRAAGIEVRETGDVYLASLNAFFDGRRARPVGPFVRSNQRYLALEHFRVRFAARKVKNPIAPRRKSP